MASTAVLYNLIARDSASATFDRVGRSASGMGSTMARVGKVVVGLGAVLVGAGAAAAKAADEAGEFQASMAKIQTMAGASAKDVQKLSGQVLKLADSTQQGPQALSEALYHLKSVGMDNVDAMKALKTASDLAAVGGADLEDTTNALAGAWRTGIKGATSFGQAASTVNAIIGAGNMSMTDFTDALGTGILPSAKTFGLSLKQVGAALALFTDEGVPASDAATRLRMSISLLGAPSAASEKQLKKIGLTGIQLANAMRGKDGLIGAVQLLKDHLDKSGLSAARQSQILSRAFGGGRSSSAILSMVNNLDVLKKKQDQVNGSTGKYGAAVAAQRKTVEAQWHLLSSNLESATIRLGTKLLPPITSFVHYLTTKALPAAQRVGSAVASLVPVDRIKRDIKSADSLLSGWWKKLETAAGVKPKTAKPKTVLPSRPALTGPHVGSGMVAPAVPVKVAGPHGGSGLSAPLTKGPGKALETDPHGGSGSVAPVTTATAAKTAKKAVEKQTSGLAKTITGVMSRINWSALGPAVGRGLGSAFSWVAGHAASLSDKLATVLGAIDWVNVGKSFGSIALPTLIGFMNNLFQPLFTVDFWKKHWLDMIIAVVSVVPVGRVLGPIGKGLTKIPWGKLGELLDHIPWGRIFNWTHYITEPIGTAVKATGRFVSGIVTGFKDAFTQKFPKVAEWLSGQLYILPTRIGDLGRLLWNKGAELVSGLGKAIVDNVPGMGNKLVRGLTKIWGRFTFWQTGLQLIQGLYNGVTSALSGVGKWTKQHIVDPVVNTVKSWFGIHSPSTVFASIGHFLISGLKNGITASAKALGGWMYSHVVAPITSRFSGAGGWLLGRGRSLVSGLKSGIWGVAKGIAGWLTSHVVSPVTSRFSKAESWLHSAGGRVVSGLKSGISGAVKSIGGWIKTHLVDPIVNAVKHFFGIHSPSRVFATIGGHLVSGLMLGMARTNGASLVKRIFGDMPSALAALVGKGLVHITSLPGKALKALGGLGDDFLGLLGLGGGGTSGANQALGKTMMQAAGWSSGQWPALKALWTRESGWNQHALNKASGAYGIPQALPATKMASAGADWRTNAATQIKWGLGYIRSRYGSPAGAWAHEGRSGWYDSGGMAQGIGYMAKNTLRPERVLSPQQTEAFERLVTHLTEGGGQQQPLIGQLTVQASPGASAEDIIGAAMYQARVARRRGVYS